MNTINDVLPGGDIESLVEPGIPGSDFISDESEINATGTTGKEATIVVNPVKVGNTTVKPKILANGEIATPQVVMPVKTKDGKIINPVLQQDGSIRAPVTDGKTITYVIIQPLKDSTGKVLMPKVQKDGSIITTDKIITPAAGTKATIKEDGSIIAKMTTAISEKVKVVTSNKKYLLIALVIAGGLAIYFYMKSKK